MRTGTGPLFGRHRFSYGLRVSAVAASILLICIVFQSPTVRAVDPDSDGDGLTDLHETSTIYYQDVEPGTVPAPIPDNDLNGSASSASFAPFDGVQPRLLANFTLDHGRIEELTGAVGYWNGSAWIDRYVWDPGRRFAGIAIASPDSVRHWQGVVPAAAAVDHPEATGKVEFRVDGVLRATVTSPVGDQYQWNWDATSLGDRLSVLNATQYDGAVARAWSQITVKVNNLLPSASWTSPAHGSTVSGTVTLRMSASDFYGIREVRFYADGVLIGNGIHEGGGSYKISWDTTTYCNNAPRTVSATAIEETSLAKTRTVSVQLNPNNDPLVCLTNPVAGGTVSGQAYPVRASTVSALGITKVEFLVDVAPFGDPWQLRFTDTAAPWEWLWDTTGDPNGPVRILAKAYNAQGRLDSHQIQVSISNAGCGACGGPNNPVEPPALATSTLTLGILTIDWPVGQTTAGTTTTVVADVTPFFPPEVLLGSLTWRFVVRDWTAGTVGNVTAITFRLEVKSNPNDAHTDDDGLDDGDDVLIHGTYPISVDSDADEARDDFEIVSHIISYSVNRSPRNATVKTAQMDPDSDDDDLLDGEEYFAGVDRVVTHPINPDTDGDALFDGPEVYTHLSNATLTDTDEDTISDYDEVRIQPMTLTVNGQTHTRNVSTLPYSPDTDGDGMRDDGEWAGSTSAGTVTDPSDFDTDDDGLGDLELWIVFAIRGMPELDIVLYAIENQQPLKYWEPLIDDYIALYTEYVVIADPLSSDSDGDGLADQTEFLLHADPRSADTDHDRLLDGTDDDPTTVELERPLIFVDAIWCCEYFQDWQLKRYRVTYSVYDTAGLDLAVIYKDGNYESPVQTHYLNGVTSATFTDNFDVGWDDPFNGARWEIYTADLNGNLDYVTLQQPTIFHAIGNFLTSASVTTLGPSDGGKLSGGWYAFRDTVVDLATLFLNPAAIFDGGRAVGDAFQEQGIGALVDLGTALYEFIDASQEEANPFEDGSPEHATFRYNWYAGYIAATIGLSLLGAGLAKAVVQGIKASTVLSKISGALGDLADVSKVAAYVNKLKDIGIVNSRILIGAVFTTAFAGAAYVWLEIFGEWFSNYIGGAFVFASVYSLGPGYSQKALKGVARGVSDGVIDSTPQMQRRLAGLHDLVGYDPLDSTAGPNRVRFMLERPGTDYVLPSGGHIIDTVVLLVGDDSFGWTHIWRKHVTGEIPGGSTFLAAYKVADERTVRLLIEESLRFGFREQVSGYADRWVYVYTPYPGRPPMVTVVDGGNIITSYPVMP